MKIGLVGGQTVSNIETGVITAIDLVKGRVTLRMRNALVSAGVYLHDITDLHVGNTVLVGKESGRYIILNKLPTSLPRAGTGFTMRSQFNWNDHFTSIDTRKWQWGETIPFFWTTEDQWEIFDDTTIGIKFKALNPTGMSIKCLCPDNFTLEVYFPKGVPQVVNPVPHYQGRLLCIFCFGYYDYVYPSWACFEGGSCINLYYNESIPNAYKVGLHAHADIEGDGYRSYLTSNPNIGYPIPGLPTWLKLVATNSTLEVYVKIQGTVPEYDLAVRWSGRTVPMSNWSFGFCRGVNNGDYSNGMWSPLYIDYIEWLEGMPTIRACE